MLSKTKSIVFAFALALLGVFGVHAQNRNITGNITAASADCSTANSCVTLTKSANDAGAAAVITGTFNATQLFEATVDNTNWTAVSAAPIDGGAAVTSTTTTGAWQITAAGFTGIRVRATPYVSGTAVVSLQVSLGAVRQMPRSPTFPGPVSVASTTPRIKLSETGAAANEGLWDFLVDSTVDGGFLSARTRTDADGTGQTIFEVQRNGTTIKHWAMGNTVANDPGDGVVRPYFRIRHAWPAITSGTGDTYRLISGRGEVTIIPAAADDFTTGMFTLHITPASEPATYNAGTTFGALTTEVASAFTNNSSVIPFISAHISDVTLGDGAGGQAGGAYTTASVSDSRMLGGIKAGASITNLYVDYKKINFTGATGGTATNVSTILVDTPARGSATFSTVDGIRIKSQNPGGGCGTACWNLYSEGDNPSRHEGLLHLGLAGVANGRIQWNGVTSGAITMKPAAAAGTWTFTLPTTAGAANQLLATDGTGITSWVNNSGGLSSRVSTQFDKTSSTVLANVTGLTATVTAGRTYAFEAILFTTSNSAGGVQFAIAGTATATAVIYEALVFNAAAISAQTRATALAAAVGGVTAVTVAKARIVGTITVNAGGTLTVQFAQNASNAAASSVLVGSIFNVVDVT
jgi:hypothetical protein